MIDREGAIEQLTSEGLDVTEWRDEAGTTYEEHAHAYREVRIVLDGSITFVVGGRESDLGPGDRIELEASKPHSAIVGPQGVHYLAGTAR